MVSNPYSGYPVTGSWYDHASYSSGGIDYPLAYGTALPSPAAGTLRISGGSGEWEAGWVGSAGRRSILELDTPAPRRIPAESTPSEGGGDMVAIVFQHQSAFGTARHYAEGETLGWSGASANGADYGGDVHLHIHGLNASGQRVDFTKFIGPTSGGDMAKSYPTRDDYRGDFNLAANQSTQLKNANGTDANIAATPDTGRLFVTGHVYAEAPAGQALDLLFILADVSTGAQSPHFVERVVAGPDGRIFANPTFQLGLASSRRVFLRIQAPSSNTATVKVTRLAADATLFQ